MSLFQVDAGRCNRDGLCVAACPKLLIELPADARTPVSVAGAEDLCNNCGHCVAICPSGALSHRAMAPADLEPVRPALLPNAEAAEHFLLARRSIRTFKDEAVPRETLAHLIDIARRAPTGSNRQQVYWLVIEDRAEVQRLAALTEDWLRDTIARQPEGPLGTYAFTLDKAAERGVDAICRGAPHLIFAHGPKGRETDGVIALTYLELAAAGLGLGACWAGWIGSAAREWGPMQEALALPEGHACYGAMMVGFAKYRYRRIPARNEAKVAWR